MYADKSNPVSVPTELKEGKLIFLKNGYVYYATKSWWDSEKRRTIDNRISIGKMVPGESDKMFPGKNYFSFFSESETTDSATGNISSFYQSEIRKEAGKFDFVMSYGPYAVLRKSAERTGLLQALQKALPGFCNEIIALAVHAIVSEQSGAQDFPGWAFDNYCGLSKPMSDSTISRTYQELGESKDRITLFFEYFREEYHKRFPCTKERVVAFDSTNQVTESKSQEKARRGKSKTGENLPIICTAMFVDEVTGISMWYEYFDGCVLDKTQTPYSLEKAKQLGYDKLFAMFDRGYYSDDNARKIKNLGIQYGMMMPETVKFVSDTIGKWKNKIRLREIYYIHEEDIYGVQTVVTLPDGTDCYAYVYYDDRTATDERNTIHGKIKFFMSEAEKRINYSEKMQKHFASRGIIVTKLEKRTEAGKNFSLAIDTKMTQQANEEAGFFMIISNSLMTARDMICIARKRDCVEKGFRDLKMHFGLSRTYTHNDMTYDGKMFVAFVSLIILQSFRWFQTKIIRAKSSETLATLIAEIRKYKIQEKKDHTWMPVYAMNKKQKIIIADLMLSEDQIEQDVRSLKLSSE